MAAPDDPGEGASGLLEQLAAIERSLDAGTYRPGPWTAFIGRAARAPRREREAMAGEVSRVGHKLHLRGRPRTMRRDLALSLELLAALVGFAGLALALRARWAPGALLSAAVLATTLQPLVKTSAGNVLGMRFAYAYLWYVEPRFKLHYGSYLAAPRWRRVVFHLAGAAGSPLAWWLCAALAAPTLPDVAALLFTVLWLHLGFEALLLVLALFGVRRVPVFGPLRLTSPGGAGHELRQAASG